MNMTLYHGEPNGASLTVLSALFEKSVEAQLVHMDLSAGGRHALSVFDQPEVAMSVEGEGPVLIVNGEGLTDSIFVACFLDDVGSGPSLRPSDPYERWAMMAWCRQIIERTAPAAAYLGCRAYPPSGTDPAIARIPSVDLKARWDDALAQCSDDARVADSETKIRQTVARIEKQLDGRAWLMGTFSIADLETYAWLAGMVELVPDAFADAPQTGEWLARVKSRPSVEKTLSLARTAAPQCTWAPGPEINRWG
jgi:GST-like protein